MTLRWVERITLRVWSRKNTGRCVKHNLLGLINFIFSPRIVRSTIFDSLVLFVLLDFPEATFGVVMSNMDYISLRAGNSNLKLHLLQEIISVQSYGIRTYKNNFIYHHIEDNMKLLIQAGFPQYHQTFVKETILWFSKDHGKNPKVFSIEDLQFGFIIWSISCGISLSVFMIEVFYVKIMIILKAWLRSLLALIIVCNWIRNRLEHVVL